MIPANRTIARHCWGENAAVICVEGGSEANPTPSDLFAALAKWLRDHPETDVTALNLGSYSDTGQDYLTVTVYPKPLTDDKIIYAYGRD